MMMQALVDPIMMPIVRPAMDLLAKCVPSCLRNKQSGAEAVPAPLPISALAPQHSSGSGSGGGGFPGASAISASGSRFRREAELVREGAMKPAGSGGLPVNISLVSKRSGVLHGDRND